jgi:hypothetical protein
MLDVLEHLLHPAEALSHAGSLLEADGLLVITVPAFPSLWTRHDDINHHLRRYTRRAAVADVRATGLEVLDARYFFHWTAAAKLLVRLADQILPGRDAIPRVPPPPVNRLLLAFSRLERRLLTPLRPPFGSSLLLVARSTRRVSLAG